MLMDSKATSFFSRLNGLELVRFCNEKLVCAARDLAEFTQRGIDANFIVSLAHKCDELEETVQTAYHGQPSAAAYSTEREIQLAMDQICETGRQIWLQNPSKYNDYVI